MKNAIYLRRRLSDCEFALIGDPSPIVPVLLGGMRRSRLIVRKSLEMGGLVNLIEYPVVPRNHSRIRLQVMANHSTNQLDRFTEVLVNARSEVLSKASDHCHEKEEV